MIAILDAYSDEAAAFIEKLNLRGQLEEPSILRTVRRILQDVQRDGDSAVIKYTRRFDAPRITINEMRVTDAEIDDAAAQVDSDFHDAIRLALTNIERFHQKQLRNSWLSTEADGVVLGHLIRPLRRIGVCVPVRESVIGFFADNESCSCEGCGCGGDCGLHGSDAESKD